MQVSSLVKSVVLGGVFILPMTVAQAADGCKFLLCMGAPNPMGIAECASTVRDVMRDLAKGKSLPSCALAGSSENGGTGSYVNYYRAPKIPPCPMGMGYGSDNVRYHQGKRTTNDFIGGAMSNVYQEEYGSANSPRYRKAYRSRVCVGGEKYAQATNRERQDGSIVRRTHEWHERVVNVSPDGAQYQFNMFVDGQLHSNHRF
jgi:hypothetical protein